MNSSGERTPRELPSSGDQNCRLYLHGTCPMFPNRYLSSLGCLVKNVTSLKFWYIINYCTHRRSSRSAEKYLWNDGMRENMQAVDARYRRLRSPLNESFTNILKTSWFPNASCNTGYSLATFAEASLPLSPDGNNNLGGKLRSPNPSRQSSVSTCIITQELADSPRNKKSFSRISFCTHAASSNHSQLLFCESFAHVFYGTSVGVSPMYMYLSQSLGGLRT